MTKPSIPQLTAQLMAAPFARNEASLPEPLVDTPLQVTLEQVRPFHLDPRRTPNPKYQQIKTSIRQRGLDQPPSITRRPHDAHFIIRNGGNSAWRSSMSCGRKPVKSAFTASSACIAPGRRALKSLHWPGIWPRTIRGAI